MMYFEIILINIVVWIIGAFIGSFCVMARYRIPRRKNLIFENSHCPKCKHKLKFLDLIPIFSYLFLRGKCRYCKSKISTRYFLGEIFSASVFILFYNLVYFKYGLSIISAYLYVFFPLIYIFMYLIGTINKDTNTVSRTVVEYGMIISTFAVFVRSVMYNKPEYISISIILFALLLNVIVVFLPKKFSTLKEEIRICIVILLYTSILSIDSVLIGLQLSMIILILKAIRSGVELKKNPNFKVKLTPLYTISIILIVLNLLKYLI